MWYISFVNCFITFQPCIARYIAAFFLTKWFSARSMIEYQWFSLLDHNIILMWILFLNTLFFNIITQKVYKREAPVHRLAHFRSIRTHIPQDQFLKTLSYGSTKYSNWGILRHSTKYQCTQLLCLFIYQLMWTRFLLRKK